MTKDPHGRGSSRPPWSSFPSPSDLRPAEGGLASRSALALLRDPGGDALGALMALAASCCAAPMAALAVVEEDQVWLLCALGLPSGPHPLVGSPWAEAGPGDAALLVEDLLAHEGFKDHPLAVGAPRVRAYAGAPLIPSGGAAIGILCVLDTAPRPWTEAQAAALRRLGRLALDHLESRARDAAWADLGADVEAQRLEAARLRGVFAAIQEGLVLKNRAGEILEANPSAARLLGLGEDQLLGRTFRDPRWRAVLPGGAPLPAERHPGEIALRTGRRVDNVTMGIEHPSGERRWLSVSALPLFGDDALEPHQVLVTLIDVTHARVTEELIMANQRRLEAALEAAEAASAFKSAFLASMSHEIRTPLNGVIGLASALALSETRPRQQEMIALIAGSGQALDGLLGDLFDLSRADAGKMDLVAVPFRLRDEFEAAAAPLAQRAQDKGVEFGLSFEGDAADAVCLGDAVRLRQVITNLASNALTFTTKGSVQIAIALSARGAREPHRLSVSVADSGPGIAPGALSSMVQGLSPATSPTARSPGPSGLGLAIARVLVELLGGEISVTSAAGIGSMFAFWIPVRRLSESDAPERIQSPGRARALKVLLVEDHPVNRKVVEVLLEPFAMTLTVAEDGLQALALYERAPYDLVLMDMQMPVMDGLTSVREIRRREQESGRARVPIAVMSANTGPEHRRGAEEAGADGFVAKPMTADALIAEIGRLVSPCAA